MVPCGTNLRLYSRGGILQADIPVQALTNQSTTSPSSTAASTTSTTPTTTNESILCALALDSHDRSHHHSSNSSSELTTSRVIIGGKMSALHLLDTTRLWNPIQISSSHHRSSTTATINTIANSNITNGTSIFHNRTVHNHIKSLNIVPTTHPITHLSHGENRVLITANGDGPEITLYDGALRGSASIGKLTGHTGGTLSMDCTRNMIVTVGHSSPGESAGPSLGTRNTPSTNPSAYNNPNSTTNRAILDATLRIYDVRMLRQITSITVPSAGGKSGAGGPVYVKFFPHQANSAIFHDTSPPLVVATADGRMFTCEPDRDRFLQSIGAIDPTYAAMQRASMRGTAFVPTPDTMRLRTPAWCLAPSGNALAAVDTEGFVYLTAPTPLVNTQTSKLGYMAEPVIKYHTVDDPWIQLSDDYYMFNTDPSQVNNNNNEDISSALLWQNLMDPTSRKLPPGLPTLLSAGLSTGNYYQPGNNLNTKIGLGDGMDEDITLITDQNVRTGIETALSAATTAVNAAKVAATATQNANNPNGNGMSNQKPVSSFAAAVLGRASSSTYVREATIAANNATNAINNAETMIYNNTRQSLPGNSFTIQEAIEDGTYDAVLLHGIGSDVPVAAPGIGLLAPTELVYPTQPSNNYSVPSYALPSLSNTEPWSSVWSTTLDKVQFSSSLHYWNDTNDPHNPSVNNRGGKHGHRNHNPHIPKLPGAGYIPAQDRASSFPMDWANETIMIPSRRRDVDPTLLALADRTGTYINNRPNHIRLKPNTLLFGKRKGYLDLDPRRKNNIYNETASRPGGWQLTNQGTNGNNGIRSRSGSMDSHSSGGSSLDLERLMRGEFDDDDNNDLDDDEDDEDIDNKSITTEASLGELLTLSTTDTNTITNGKTLLHIPRAYRRPKLMATRVGFFDFDFASYNHSPFPIAGFEEVGPNSFVNAALQLLFYARGFRRRIQRHLCSHPACVSCEMRFVFDVACQAPIMPSDSRVATAQNFIRALQFVTEVKRAGLLHPCELEPTRRMSLFIRTIIDRISREITSTSYLGNISTNSGTTLPNSSGTQDTVTMIPIMGVNTDTEEINNISSSVVPNKHEKHHHKDKHYQQMLANKYLTPISDTAALNAIVGIPNNTTSEAKANESVPKENAGVESLFGLRTLLVAMCTSGHTTQREFTSSMVDLIYPANIFPPPVPTPSDSSNTSPTLASVSPSTVPTFSSLLQGSMGTHKRTKAWCEGCKGYVWLTQYRVCVDTGPLLLISTNPLGGGSDGSIITSTTSPILNPNATGEVSGTTIKDLWTNPNNTTTSWISKKLQILPGKDYPITDATTPVPNMQPPTGLQITEYNDTNPATTITDKQNNIYELVGMVMHINVEQSKSKVAKRLLRARRTIPTTETENTPNPSVTSGTSTIQQETTALARYHYVSCLKVNSSGTYAPNSSDDRWLIFNDFRITPTTSKEIFDIKTPWKVPTVLLYQRINHETGLPPSIIGMPSTANEKEYQSFYQQRKALGYVYPSGTKPPIGSSISSSNTSMFTSPWPQPLHPLLADITHIPSTVFSLPPSIPHQPVTGAAPTNNTIPVHLVPKDGMVVAIDAEFVAVATERSRILSDGSRRVLAQARLMPGRVSIVQSSITNDTNKTNNPNTVPVMDAYISASEPVVDYLTRFSGLMPNDLDPTLSPHRLHTYKDTYMKLRALIDNGTIFIGHGLRKDCRELGIFLPPPQVIDTVKLYKLDGQRYLSLKFLSSHVLSSDIQSNVHDSCEDAISALALYNHYRNIHEQKISALTPDMEQSMNELFGTSTSVSDETSPTSASVPTDTLSSPSASLNMNNTGEAGFERLLHHLYDIGRSTGWRARAITATPTLMNIAPTTTSSSSSSSNNTSMNNITNMLLHTSLNSTTINAMGQSLHGGPEDAPSTPHPLGTSVGGNTKSKSNHNTWPPSTSTGELSTQSTVFVPNNNVGSRNINNNNASVIPPTTSSSSSFPNIGRSMNNNNSKIMNKDNNNNRNLNNNRSNPSSTYSGIVNNNTNTNSSSTYDNTSGLSTNSTEFSPSNIPTYRSVSTGSSTGPQISTSAAPYQPTGNMNSNNSTNTNNSMTRLPYNRK